MGRGAITRRRALGAAAGAAAGATAGRLGAAEPASARPRRREVDIAIVGAGLAGLAAARRIVAGGRSAVVLEARDRVGGRTYDVDIGGGHRVELGGQWAGPGQDRVLELAAELGIATFPTYFDGEGVYYAGGRRQTYAGDLPPMSPASLAELLVALQRLNQMASEVPPGAPWDAARAAEFDRQTVGGWAVDNLATSESRALVDVVIEGVYGCEPQDLSLLDLLAAIGGVGGDVFTLIDDAQSTRFVGGSQRLSKGLARRLGRRVQLESPVRSIRRSGRRAHLETPNGTWVAKQVIVTIPRPLTTRIRHRPPLPAAHDQLAQRQPFGSVVKVNAVYDEPFWRADGLNGYTVSDTGPIKITYDNSPPEGSPGVLVGFMEGNDGRAFYGDHRARRAAALECFARYYGERAREPRRYVDIVWPAEQWTRGAYGSFNPPGVITAFRGAGTGPVGPMRFAGSDLSSEWTGYMEGALRSGVAAAEEALEEL